LSWRQITNSNLPESDDTAELHDAYRLGLLRETTHEEHLMAAVEFFKSREIDALMFKGWTVARLYPERGLRPYGDIDVVVPLDQTERASTALLDPDRPAVAIDLHPTLPDLAGREVSRMFERAHTVQFRGANIRIPCAEDHLRILSIHMMRHGACRPSWLVDVALFIEQIDESFDWNYFLEGNRRYSRTRGWLLGVIGLAEKVLGARIEHLRVADEARRLPRWLYPALIRQWGNTHYMQGPSMAYSMASGPQAASAAWARWPNPIQATVRMGGKFNNAPRLPYQAGEFLRRGVRFLRS
jgi:hypothetical protein